MKAGKIAAQCCHAALGVYRTAARASPGSDVSTALKEWEARGEAKIVLKVKDLGQLQTLQEAAEALGLIHHMVRDAGHTQVRWSDSAK